MSQILFATEQDMRMKTKIVIPVIVFLFFAIPTGVDIAKLFFMDDLFRLLERSGSDELRLAIAWVSGFFGTWFYIAMFLLLPFLMFGFVCDSWGDCAWFEQYPLWLQHTYAATLFLASVAFYVSLSIAVLMLRENASVSVVGHSRVVFTILNKRRILLACAVPFALAVILGLFLLALY